MMNLQFTETDYREIEATAKKIFNEVLHNYTLYEFDTSYQSYLINREDIQLEILSAMVDSYFIDTNNPYCVKAYNDYFIENISSEAYDYIEDELFAIFSSLLQKLIKEAGLCLVITTIH